MMVTEFLFVPVALMYLTLIGMLFAYGIGFYYLTFLALKNRNYSPSIHKLETWPKVTVQLPIYNELYVSERLVEAASKLNYPAHLLEIQVLDDSTDDTVNILRQKVASLRAEGVNITYLHRDRRLGYKAGALAEGMRRTEGEYLAIFDADFVPPPDFLVKTIPFFQDPQIAFVQTRWGHLNRKFSLLTLLQSLSIDAHFMIEQFARSRGGYWFNFNGTAGVWRRAAIEEAGGWKAETLTEDLDLSYRAFLHGWRALYLRDVCVPAELPVSFHAFRRQQHRWARGSLECSLQFIGRVWDQDLPLGNKLVATLHLTGYCVHLLLFGLLLVYPVVLLLSLGHPYITSLFGLAVVMNSTALAPTILYIVSQQQSGRKWWLMIPTILFATLLGHGMMLNTVRAATEILLKRKKSFERTPKYGELEKKENWNSFRYQLRLDPLVIAELAFALLAMLTGASAFYLHRWGIAIYSSIFCLGLFFTSGMTIREAISLQMSQRKNTMHQHPGNPKLWLKMNLSKPTRVISGKPTQGGD